MHDARLIALILCGCLEILFCRIILQQRKLSWDKYHLYLIIYVLFGLSWIIGSSMALFGRSQPIVTAGLFVFTIGPMMATHFIMEFSYSFLGKQQSLPRIIRGLSFTYIIGFMAFTAFFFNSFYFIESVNYSGVNTLNVSRIPYLFYSLYFLIFFQVSYFIHVKALKDKNKSKVRKNVLYSFIAILFAGTVGMVTNLGIPTLFGTLRYIWIGPLVGVGFVVTSTYAIITYRLFDIRSSALRAVGYSLSVASIVILYSILIYGFVLPVFQPDASFEPINLVMIVVGTAATIFLFDKVKVFFDAITDRLFFKNNYRLPVLLDDLNQALINSSDIEDLAKSVFKILGDNLKTEFFVLIVKHDNFEMTIDSRKEEPLRETEAELSLSLVNYHFKKGDRVVFKDYTNLSSFSGLNERLSKSDISAAIDLSEASKATHSLKKALESGNFKTLLLGPKKSGEAYNTQDLDALKLIAKELVIALQNSMRFEEIKLFNLELQKKIDLATAKLKDQNKKLVVADELKDDFLSIASHQMRTPISAINGYASILSSGDAGKLNKDQKKFAKIIEDSTKRLSYLINDFLTVSRLKSGKFSIEKTDADLKEILRSEVTGLTNQFKTKEVRLVVEIDEHVPNMKADGSKIRQVMMNFIDNAMHYTKTGGEVKVSLKTVSNNIVFEVKDSGIGVPKADQAKLFGKMFRASNAQNMRPDGNGLGLYLAKKVILGHKGHIIFKSEEGVGSTFGFKIPKK